MKFPRIDNAISVCRSHLKAHGASSASIEEIKSYMVGYCLTIIYAEYEQKVRTIINKRASLPGSDASMQHFVKYFFSKKGVGRISVSDLGETLSRFGPSCKRDFIADVVDKAPHLSWDRIITARHSIAHQGGTNITFEELELSYHDSRLILLAFARAIGLSSAQIAECA